MKNLFIAISCIVALIHAEAQSLTLGSPFTEHMVLQRELPVPVWGWGSAGKKVVVSVAGQKATTTVKADGSWQVELSPLKSGGPYTFEVSTEGKKITYKDVLVGEVWICSGQSNMQFGRGRMIGVKKMLQEATGRPLRSMNVKQMVSFEPAKKCKGSWSASPSSSAVAFAFSLELQKELGDVPVGVIVTCWGSSSIEAWMPLDLIKVLPSFKKIMDEFNAGDRAEVERLLEKVKNGERWTGKENILVRRSPNILYNAMMAPLIPYAARGMVWYQGERNAKTIESMFQYPESLKVWTKRMRKAWGRDDFYMNVVMLPGYGSPKPDPNSKRSWAWMRESQLKILDLPHTGVAVTVDLGEAKNIHPHDKAPVGKRLALLALRDTCGKNVEAQGPTFKAVQVVGNKIRVQFDHAAGLKTTDGKAPRSFWVSEDAKNWIPATAKISNNAVILTSKEVSHPKYVCYAFVSVPDVNLVNGAGLPAAPFRTDSVKP